MDFEGNRSCSFAYIKDEEDRRLRDTGLIRDRWVQPFRTSFNTKSPVLDPDIVEELKVWPPFMPLDDLPSIF